MFFSASERLAEASTELGDLAERLDAFLGQANESWVLNPDEVASSLGTPRDQVHYLLDLAASASIALLRAEPYLRCNFCGNLMPVDDTRATLGRGDEIDCTQCCQPMAGTEPEVTVYRLSSQAAKEARARSERPARTAVILSALELEHHAVHAYLDKLERHVHAAGTVYFVGSFASPRAIWRVATIAIRAGNPGAAAETERAIQHFNPEVVLFVGIAGGIKDVLLGDVVAANEVYLYHAGKALDDFKPRPDVYRSAYALVQQASATALEARWSNRVAGPDKPSAIVEPIAAGEQVVTSKKADTYRFLREHYDRAVAVEMEGAGFLRAAYGNQHVQALIIRGISDLLDDKQTADTEGWQTIAAAHAAAFSFDLLANLP